MRWHGSLRDCSECRDSLKIRIRATPTFSETTVKTWCSVLEASHVAAPLRLWFANIGKRLAKSLGGGIRVA